MSKRLIALLASASLIAGSAAAQISPPSGATLGANTFTDVQTNTAPSAASTPAHIFTGAIFTGGSGTTTFPHVLIQPSTATASTTWSTSGTAFGINAHTGIGILASFRLDGADNFDINTDGSIAGQGSILFSNGGITIGGNNSITFNTRGKISSGAANQIIVGPQNSGAPASQTVTAVGSRGGTDTNVAGGDLTIQAGLGTGNATASKLHLAGTHIAGSGTTQQTAVDQIVIGDNTVTMPALTTGTNADFVCATAGLVLLIQSSACTISSRRFKDHIVYGDDWAFNDVMKLRPVTFQLKPTGNKNPNATKPQRGLIAEDVAKVDPKLAIYEDDMKTPKSYRQEAISAALIGTVQHEQAEIDALKTLVAKLETVH